MRVLVLFLFFTVLQAKADMCFRSFEKDTAKSSLVFVGKIVEIKNNAYWINRSPRDIVNFRIYKSFKGLRGYEEIISIVTPVGGCCSPNFSLDSTYLVFANGIDFLYTNDCSNSRLLTQSKEHLEKLGKSISHATLNKRTFHIETVRDSVQYYKLIIKEAQKENRNWVIGLIISLSIVIAFMLYKRFR